MKNQNLKKILSDWFVWLFPLFAILIAVWLFKDFYEQRGTLIKIYFDDAAGIQPEKTRIRYRGVPVGTVKKVYISEDHKDVVAEVLLRKDAAHFAVEGSKFSLVLPKIDFQGVTGLETLFEGTYITVLPGREDGSIKTVFKAQGDTNATDPLDDTSPFILETPNAESVSPGDSVTFRGLKIGTVTKLNLSRNSKNVLIQINIEHRFARVIRTNTMFWRKVGVHAKLGLFKSELTINSMDSIMRGGVELFNPTPVGPRAKAFHKFELHAKPPDNWQKWDPQLDESEED